LHTSVASLLTSASSSLHSSFFRFYFFPAPSPTHIYTLSLHDALPISLISISFKYRTYLLNNFALHVFSKLVFKNSAVCILSTRALERSEERRVGKECRSRWLTCD